MRFLTTKEDVTLLTQFFPPARLSVLDSDAFLTTNPRVSPEDMKNVIARRDRRRSCADFTPELSWKLN